MNDLPGHLTLLIFNAAKNIIHLLAKLVPVSSLKKEDAFVKEIE